MSTHTDILLGSKLLEQISSGAVRDLIIQYQLEQEGYQFHYIIDPFDLENYCFPFGVRKEKRGKKPKSIGLMADETLGLHSIFENESVKFLILDEYFEEISNFEWHAKRMSRETKNSTERFWKEYDKDFADDLLTKIKIPKGDLSLLIALAVGLYHEGLEKIYNLREQRRLLIDHRHDSLHSGIPDYALEVIHRTRATESSKEIFKWLIESVRRETEPGDRRFIYSKERDSKAVDRVLAINRNLLEAEVAGKEQRPVLMLYLSSGSLSRSLFGEPFISQRFPVVNGLIFNPLRTSAQLFLRMLCEEKDHHQKTIEGFESWYQLLKVREDSGSFEHHPFSKVLELQRSKLEEWHKRSKTYQLLYQFNNYKQEIRNIESRKGFEVQSRIFKELLRLTQEKKEAIDTGKTESFNILKNEEKFFAILRIGLGKLHTDPGFRLASNFGKDNIKSLYHRLPVVIFGHPDRETSVLQQITSFMLEPDEVKRNYENLAGFIARITSELYHLKEEEFELARCLLLLLFPKFEEMNTSPGEVVLDYLKEKLNDPIEKEHEKNLLYIAAWAARRLGPEQYGEALDLSKRGKLLDDSDPRFHHSICLVHYCRFPEIKGDVSRVDHLKSVIYDCQEALKRYGAQKRTDAVQKSIHALYNMLIYIWCKLFELTENEPWLEKAKGHLKDLRRLEPNFDFLPEFLHTEATLYYHEARISYHRKETDLAQSLLKDGIRTLNRAEEKLHDEKSSEPWPADMKELRDKISNLQEELLGSAS